MWEHGRTSDLTHAHTPVPSHAHTPLAAMTIHPVQADTSESLSTPYDTIWSAAEVPTQSPEGFERVMLSHDKIYVVLAVVLIIWLGFVFFLFRTDRRITRLERGLDE